MVQNTCYGEWCDEVDLASDSAVRKPEEVVDPLYIVDLQNAQVSFWYPWGGSFLLTPGVYR